MSKPRERAKEPIVKMNKQLVALNEAAKQREESRKLSLRNAEIYTHMAEMIFGGIIVGGLFESGKSIVFLGALYTAGIIGFVLLLRLGKKCYKQRYKRGLIW